MKELDYYELSTFKEQLGYLDYDNLLELELLAKLTVKSKNLFEEFETKIKNKAIELGFFNIVTPFYSINDFLTETDKEKKDAYLSIVRDEINNRPKPTPQPVPTPKPNPQPKSEPSNIINAPTFTYSTPSNPTQDLNTIMIGTILILTIASFFNK